MYHRRKGGKHSYADNSTVCDSRGNCIVRDNLWSVGGSFKGFSGSYASKLADNSTVCDSRGNCIVGDELFINFSKVGKVNIGGDITVHEGKNGTAGNMIKVDKVGIFDVAGDMKIVGHGSKLADNSTVCDSRGNCIVRDSLWSVGGSFKGFSGSYASKLAANSTVCDSRGNCIVKDNLYAKKTLCRPAGEKKRNYADNMVDSLYKKSPCVPLAEWKKMYPNGWTSEDEY